MSDNEKTTRPLRLFTRRERETMRQGTVTRRRLLQGPGYAAVLVAGGSMAGAGAGTAIAYRRAQETVPSDLADGQQFEGVPMTPAEPPPQEFEALSEEQGAMVEALTARLLPGDADDPGAREAGVVYFIDYLLSYNEGIAEATYQQGPWAQPYEGDEPPEEDDEETIWVEAEELGRYGYQSPLTPLEIYQIGLEVLENHAQEQLGGPIAELEEEDQDQIIWDMLDQNIEGFDQFSSISFFHTLRRHTAQGMFSDPAYGGNIDMAGWQLVGFPGAQRAYAPHELVETDEPREPQAMADLTHFHPRPDQAGDEIIHPIRGAERLEEGDPPEDEEVEDPDNDEEDDEDTDE